MDTWREPRRGAQERVAVKGVGARLLVRQAANRPEQYRAAAGVLVSMLPADIRKAALQEWRREFARHLRSHGVAAKATERSVRGETRVHKRDGIFRAHARGASAHMRERVEAVAAELLKGDVRIEPGNAKILQTRRDVLRGWQVVSEILASQGERDLATHVRFFLERMPPPETDKGTSSGWSSYKYRYGSLTTA